MLIQLVFGPSCTRNIPLLVEDILSFEFNVNSTVRRNEPRVSCEIGLFSESRRDFEIDGDLTDAKSTSPLRRYANQPSYLFVDQASPREWICILHVVPFSYQRVAFKSTHVRHVRRARATPLPRFCDASNSPNDRSPNRRFFLKTTEIYPLAEELASV